MRSNQLTKLPDEIGELKELVELNVGKNQLTAISNETSQLTPDNDMSIGRMLTLPEAVFDLTELEDLYLSGNYLKELPTSIKKLKISKG